MISSPLEIQLHSNISSKKKGGHFSFSVPSSNRERVRCVQLFAWAIKEATFLEVRYYVVNYCGERWTQHAAIHVISPQLGCDAVRPWYALAAKQENLLGRYALFVYMRVYSDKTQSKRAKSPVRWWKWRRNPDTKAIRHMKTARGELNSTTGVTSSSVTVWQLNKYGQRSYSGTTGFCYLLLIIDIFIRRSRIRQDCIFSFDYGLKTAD